MKTEPNTVSVFQMKKKIGLQGLLDVIPLDATLRKWSRRFDRCLQRDTGRGDNEMKTFFVGASLAATAKDEFTGYYLLVRSPRATPLQIRA